MRKRQTNRHGVTPLRGLLPLVLALGVWQVLADSESPYFPPPSKWAGAIGPLVSDGELINALVATSWTFLLALATATLLGAALGAAIGSSRVLDQALGPTFEFLRILPAAALVPVAALLLGNTVQMKLAVVILPSLWPVLLTCRAARKTVSPVLLDSARTVRLSRWERTRKVIAPSLVPAVLLGVRLAAPLALIITLLVEIVTRIDGLGSLIAEAQGNFLSAQVYGLLVIAGVLGVLVNWAVTRLDAVIGARRGPQPS